MIYEARPCIGNQWIVDPGVDHPDATIFCGSGNEKRAQEYAAFKNARRPVRETQMSEFADIPTRLFRPQMSEGRASPCIPVNDRKPTDVPKN